MSFETEFWPWYLSLHGHPLVRVAHAGATLTNVTIVVTAIVTGHPALALVGPLADYLIAQASHRLVEGNATRPWRHPWLHARAEVRLCVRTLGELAGGRLARAAGGQ